MIWSISSFPKCLFHVFLSHCSEDKGWLVDPLFDRLGSRGIIPWYDRHHYPAGTDSFDALRRELLRCRCVIYLITLATLDSGRGWQILERAYGGIIQDSLSYSGTALSRIELPLLFVPRNHPTLARSVWFPILEKALFHSPQNGHPIEWAADMIEQFIRREERGATSILASISNDPFVRAWVNARPGIEDRIAARYP